MTSPSLNSVAIHSPKPPPLAASSSRLTPLSPAGGNWRWGLFLRPRLFQAWGVCVTITAIGFFYPPLMYVGLVLATAVLLAAALEYAALNRAAGQLSASRTLEPRLSLGDDNPVSVQVANASSMRLAAELVEELPVQFQERDFRQNFVIGPGETKLVKYQLRPLERGAFEFGRLLLMVRTRLGLVERRFGFGPETQTVAVYPSILQMRQQALRMKMLLRREGSSQRQRQLGRSYEFDQIKTYVAGDDYRSLNWKATARANALMANTYVEERSQQIVALVDTSRTMLSPFEGLSLLDYAVNSTLALLNVALLRGDRIGLVGFDKTVHSRLAPSARPEQLLRVMELLYAQAPTDFEPDYDALGQYVQRFVKGRSLLMLYTNFETIVSLERNLPALRRMSRTHLLMVVIFVNAEVAELVHQNPRTLEAAYLATIAAEYEARQTQIASTLVQNGILVLRTRPQELTATAVSNYLSVKRGGRL